MSFTIQFKKSAFYILAFLFLLNLFAWIVVYELSQPRFLEVTFFDVGQGDAIFIETPQKHQILIDGGPSSIILEKLNQEMPFWDRSIDLIILTHPEHDHIAGLIEVLKRYKIENILWTGVVRDTNEYQEWQKLIEQENAEIKIAQAPLDVYYLTGQAGQNVNKGAVLHILHPFENLAGQEVKNSNNTSIIAKLVFGENSFLLTGDVYKSIERKLIERGAEIDSDILKVGHHGSKTSSSEEFLEKVSPEIAVISAGKDNKYGHPHQEVLERLENYGIKILRTDKGGDIKIVSNGNYLKILNPKSEFLNKSQ